MLTASAACDVLLDYRDPSVDTWRTDDLPRLKQIPLKVMAALTGLSERRLRDIYAGRSNPRNRTKDRLRSLLADTPPISPCPVPDHVAMGDLSDAVLPSVEPASRSACVGRTM